MFLEFGKLRNLCVCLAPPDRPLWPELSITISVFRARAEAWNLYKMLIRQNPNSRSRILLFFSAILNTFSILSTGLPSYFTSFSLYAAPSISSQPQYFYNWHRDTTWQQKDIRDTFKEHLGRAIIVTCDHSIHKHKGMTWLGLKIVTFL